MNVHISYKLRKTPELEKQFNHLVEKLRKRLQVFRPELLHLKGVVEEGSPREGTTVSLNLRLPSGQLAAQRSASTAVAAIKTAFDDLLQRIHPAASRIRKLSQETPALYLAFDLLATAGDKKLAAKPLSQRRPMLEAFAKGHLKSNPTFRLSPVTASYATAQKWLARAGGGCDGVIAKRLDLPYQSGNRDGMQKIKNFRSADCVVGGFRYATNPLKGKKVVGSLLLGLYDRDGLLHHVGFTSAIKQEDKPALTAKLEPLIAKPGFTGNAPGGPSRWSTERSAEWYPLRPKLVVEVAYDHFSGERFRHGTSIQRWRPDKAPRQCTFDQLKQTAVNPMKLLA